MPQQLISHAFIEHQHPLPGQLCVVELLDTITTKYKYRIRFLPASQFGRSIELDCRETARFGSKLPEDVGRTMILSLGEQAEESITL